ncbi:hypothetical protein SNEBB_010962 [Seison nebaliae]|nr:hypothetical protein SNEBB_010962 [Seison nebaliae]
MNVDIFNDLFSCVAKQPPQFSKQKYPNSSKYGQVNLLRQTDLKAHYAVLNDDDDVTLECNIDTSPDTIVTWYQKYDTKRLRKLKSGIINKTKKIDVTVPTDRGIIMVCEAKNCRGKFTIQFYIQRKKIPSTTTRRTTTTESSSTSSLLEVVENFRRIDDETTKTITTTTKKPNLLGSLVPETKGSFNEELILPSNVLGEIEFEGDSMEENNENSERIKQIENELELISRNEENVENIFFEIGDRAILTCRIMNENLGKIHWLKKTGITKSWELVYTTTDPKSESNDETIYEDENEPREYESYYESKMTFNNVQESDSGLYGCSAMIDTKESDEKYTYQLFDLNILSNKNLVERQKILSHRRSLSQNPPDTLSKFSLISGNSFLLAAIPAIIIMVIALLILLYLHFRRRGKDRKHSPLEEQYTIGRKPSGSWFNCFTKTTNVPTSNVIRNKNTGPNYKYTFDGNVRTNKQTDIDKCFNNSHSCSTTDSGVILVCNTDGKDYIPTGVTAGFVPNELISKSENIVHLPINSTMNDLYQSNKNFVYVKNPNDLNCYGTPSYESLKPAFTLDKDGTMIPVLIDSRTLLHFQQQPQPIHQQQHQLIIQQQQHDQLSANCASSENLLIENTFAHNAMISDSSTDANDTECSNRDNSWTFTSANSEQTKESSLTNDQYYCDPDKYLE